MSTSMGENLIFLISQPRAGSTLLQLILSGHPDVATTSEPWIALHLIYALREKGIHTEYNSEIARLAFLDFLKQSGVDDNFYKKQVANVLLSLYEQSLTYQQKKKFLDKTPRYSLIVHELLQLFPLAKFVILLRNPLAVLSSILRTWIKDDLTMLGEFRNDLMVAPSKLVNVLKKYPERCIKVKYEELVTNPEMSVKRICGFLEIPFHSNMLSYSNQINTEWNFGDPVGIHKSTKPNSNSLNSWEKGFDSVQKKIFAMSYLKALGPQLINEMGYDYSKLEKIVNISGTDPQESIISWSTIMSEFGGFSQIHEVRNLFFSLLLDDKIPLGSDIGLVKNKNNPEWDEIFKRMVIESKKSIQPIIDERDALLNSYSWKITAPLRAFGRFLRVGKR